MFDLKQCEKIYKKDIYLNDKIRYCINTGFYSISNGGMIWKYDKFNFDEKKKRIDGDMSSVINQIEKLPNIPIEKIDYEQQKDNIVVKINGISYDSKYIYYLQKMFPKGNFILKEYDNGLICQLILCYNDNKLVGVVNQLRD